MKDVNYAGGKTPAEYVCGECGATGCKLWREYSVSHTDLFCATCAEQNQRESHSAVRGRERRRNARGWRGFPGWVRGRRGTRSVPSHWRSSYSMGEGDQIGWLVPAVPDEEGAGYWGYTSVPQAGCAWWRNLPTRSPVSAAPREIVPMMTTRELLRA